MSKQQHTLLQMARQAHKRGGEHAMWYCLLYAAANLYSDLEYLRRSGRRVKEMEKT